MVFENGVKNIEAAAYNGSCMGYKNYIKAYNFKISFSYKKCTNRFLFNTP